MAVMNPNLKLALKELENLMRSRHNDEIDIETYLTQYDVLLQKIKEIHPAANRWAKEVERILAAEGIHVPRHF